MAAYLVLLFAVVSRILPHSLHPSWNFTAVGGGLLFFGSQLATTKSPTRRAAQIALAVAALIATDFYLTTFVFHYPFHPASYLTTWAWYAAICLLGLGLLSKPSVLRVAGGVLASSTSFFLISNFMVWARSHMYPHTAAGLGTCYLAGLPFYRNDLASTALVAGALFGLPVLAAKIVEAIQSAQNDNLPTA